MSWLSEGIDKARKAVGLPVISTANAGKIVGQVATVAASVVPGGNALVKGFEDFFAANQGNSPGQVAQAGGSTAASRILTAAQAQQAAYNATHSATTVFVLVGIIVAVLLFKD